MTTPTHEPDRLLRRWLAAERADRAAAAEDALTAVFTRLPRPLPRAGFADRVLATARPAPWVPARWMRWSIAASLFLTALAAAYLPRVAAAFGLLIGPSEVVVGFTRGLTGLADALDGAVAAWRMLAHLQRILEIIGASPPVILALVTAIVASGLALYFLTDLLVPNRSLRHET